ncbi:hypothetical protein SNEBB_005410 [Seison nebaliae]|nr:hypothetical protein SNEBB_005410 [Seison nebaliae]
MQSLFSFRAIANFCIYKKIRAPHGRGSTVLREGHVSSPIKTIAIGISTCAIRDIRGATSSYSNIIPSLAIHAKIANSIITNCDESIYLKIKTKIPNAIASAKSLAKPFAVFTNYFAFLAITFFVLNRDFDYSQFHITDDDANSDIIIGIAVKFYCPVYKNMDIDLKLYGILSLGNETSTTFDYRIFMKEDENGCTTNTEYVIGTFTTTIPTNWIVDHETFLNSDMSEYIFDFPLTLTIDEINKKQISYDNFNPFIIETSTVLVRHDEHVFLFSLPNLRNNAWTKFESTTYVDFVKNNSFQLHQWTTVYLKAIYKTNCNDSYTNFKIEWDSEFSMSQSLSLREIKPRLCQSSSLFLIPSDIIEDIDKYSISNFDDKELSSTTITLMNSSNDYVDMISYTSYQTGSFILIPGSKLMKKAHDSISNNYVEIDYYSPFKPPQFNGNKVHKSQRENGTIFVNLPRNADWNTNYLTNDIIPIDQQQTDIMLNNSSYFETNPISFNRTLTRSMKDMEITDYMNSRNSKRILKATDDFFALSSTDDHSSSDQIFVIKEVIKFFESSKKQLKDLNSPYREGDFYQIQKSFNISKKQLNSYFELFISTLNKIQSNEPAQQMVFYESFEDLFSNFHLKHIPQHQPKSMRLSDSLYFSTIFFTSMVWITIFFFIHLKSKTKSKFKFHEEMKEEKINYIQKSFDNFLRSSSAVCWKRCIIMLVIIMLFGLSFMKNIREDYIRYDSNIRKTRRQLMNCNEKKSSWFQQILPVDMFGYPSVDTCDEISMRLHYASSSIFYELDWSRIFWDTTTDVFFNWLPPMAAMIKNAGDRIFLKSSFAQTILYGLMLCLIIYVAAGVIFSELIRSVFGLITNVFQKKPKKKDSFVEENDRNKMKEKITDKIGGTSIMGKNDDCQIKLNDDELFSILQQRISKRDLNKMNMKSILPQINEEIRLNTSEEIYKKDFPDNSSRRTRLMSDLESIKRLRQKRRSKSLYNRTAHS